MDRPANTRSLERHPCILHGCQELSPDISQVHLHKVGFEAGISADPRHVGLGYRHPWWQLQSLHHHANPHKEGAKSRLGKKKEKKVNHSDGKDKSDYHYE